MGKGSIGEGKKKEEAPTEREAELGKWWEALGQGRQGIAAQLQGPGSMCPSLVPRL